MLGIQGQTESVNGTLYSYDKELGIFDMHYHTDMISNGMASVVPIGSTG